jgi:chemotaxis protein CheZ
MAQSYQDLSGQIIRTVIKLVAELERTLAHFSQIAGEGGVEQDAVAAQPVSGSNGFGPAVPGVTTGAVGEQGDVDDLLADLGM